MIRKILNRAALAVIATFCLVGCDKENESSENNVYKFTESTLPAGKGHAKQAGLANPFAGKIKLGDNDVLVVAGGANFSSQETATDADLKSGKAAPNLTSSKVYHTDVFVGTEEENSLNFTVDTLQIPDNAYGASVVVNNKLFCIGGQNSQGNLDTVYYITAKDGKLVTANTVEVTKGKEKISLTLPKLPKALAKIKAISLGNDIYVAGGNMQSMLKLNLKPKADKDGNVALKWEEVKTILPMPISLPILVAQNNKIYILGGMGSVNGVTQALTKNYVYSLDNEKENKLRADDNQKYIWKEIDPCVTEAGEEISFGGGYAVAVGPQNVIAIGGVNTKIFNDYLNKMTTFKTMTAEQKDAEVKKYFHQAPAAYNFNKGVYNLNTVTDKWIKLQDYPFTGPAGAPIVKLSNNGFKIAVINGEIKPGVRTDRVAVGNFVRNPTFGVLNYIVLFAYMIGMLLLGFYFMKKEGGTDDFFKGGGRIPWWAAGISIYATMLSSITFMALPASVFMKSWAPFMSAIMIFATAPIIVKYYLPFFRRLNVTTAYEYLEIRFNPLLRVLSSILFMVFKVARLGIVSYLPAVALTAVTDMSIDVCIVVVAVITMVYCSMGGVEAVIWGDVIQGIVLIGGALIVVAIIIFSVDGGFGGIVELGQANHKFDAFNFALDWTEPTFWVIVIGGLGINLSSYSGDQSVVQRYLTTKDEKSAAQSIIFNGVASVGGSIVFYFIGTAMYTFYTQMPETLTIVSDKNEILPYFVVQNLPAGVAGLLIAALFSATMSTLSSDLNSAATAYTSDIHKKLKPNAEDRHLLSVARYATVLFGIMGTCFALALAHMEVGDMFELFNAVVGLLASSLGGLFLLGIFTKRVGEGAALSGFVSSIAVLSAIKFGGIWAVSGWLYGSIGLVISVVVALLVSLIFPNKKEIKGLTIYTLNK